MHEGNSSEERDEYANQEILHAVQPYESVDREESKRESQYYLPEEIAEDIGHPTSRKGWNPYWQERLDEEIKSLPEEVRTSPSALNQWMRKQVNEHIGEGRYIEQRMQVMHKLASRLAEIDQHIDYPESEHQFRRMVQYSEETNEPYVMTEDGQAHVLDIDNITTDIDWGVVYRPDANMPPELWRSIRKRMDITEARRNIEEIYNEELAKREGVSLPTTSISGVWLEEHFNPNNSSIAGIIGERMAKNALHSLGHQHKEMGLRVENSNAFEDAALKYDFKIALPNITRGVATVPFGVDREEYVATKRNVGVQFTISKDSKILRKKEGQLRTVRERIGDDEMRKYTKRPISDIILVSLRLDASKRYAQWLSAGKPPGGPEQYISEEERNELFAKITEGLEEHMRGEGTSLKEGNNTQS